MGVQQNNGMTMTEKNTNELDNRLVEFTHLNEIEKNLKKMDRGLENQNRIKRPNICVIWTLIRKERENEKEKYLKSKKGLLSTIHNSY